MHFKSFEYHTVGPRFNVVLRYWGNWFVKSRIRYIEVLFSYILP